ncbi:MAG TPA: hypothetical protein DHW42_05280 [Candidatus Marinimicrobia bacterium]|nr:hypothetical protein [Candidatus Neomarinimicrobiota bacterium]
MSRNKRSILIVGFSLFFVVFTGCEKQLPHQYQDEDFVISDIDEKACYYLSCDLTVIDTVVTEGADTVYVERPVYVPITPVTDLVVDSVWINASDSLINAMFDDTLIVDTTLLISNSEEADTSYAFYNHIAPNNEDYSTVYFFISWDFTEQNMNSYIDIDIFQRDAKLVNAETTAIAPETIAGCTELVELMTGDEIVPKIKTRYVYKLAEGHYLVRFIISDPSVIGNFRMAILSE